MYDVICFGAATQDIFIKIASSNTEFQKNPETNKEMLCFEHGSKIPVEEAITEIGGGALNTAIAYKYLGLHPAVVVAVGRDVPGNTIENRIAEHDIGDTFVVRLAGVHTGFSTIVTTVRGDRTAFVYRGANDYMSPDVIKKFENIAKTKWLSVSHLSGKSDLLLQDIVKLKEENPSIRVAWNPGFTQLKKGIEAMKPLLKHTTVLLLNRSESELLCNKTCDESAEGLKDIARKLEESGPEIVVISDGEGGALAFHDGMFYDSTVFPTNVVNTTGAGDAFMAGFVAGYEHSKGEIDVALSFGSANAAGVISQFGAQNGLLTLKQIEKMIQTNPSFTIEKEEA